MTSPGARSRVLADRTLRVLRLPLRTQLTLAHAVLVFTLVESTIRQARIERLARVLGVSVDLRPIGTTDRRLPIEALPLDARRRLRCAQRVASVWPFSDGPCLRVALVGGHLVRRLDPTIRFGVGDDDSSISAHAWLEIEGRPLEDVARYTRFEIPSDRNTAHSAGCTSACDPIKVGETSDSRPASPVRRVPQPVATASPGRRDRRR